MIVRYPHQLKAIILGKTVQDTNGDFIADDYQQAIESSCRAEQRTENIVVTTTDGKKLEVSMVIYMPASTPTIPFGSELILSEQSNIIVKGTCKGFFRGYNHCRVWV